MMEFRGPIYQRTLRAVSVLLSLMTFIDRPESALGNGPSKATLEDIVHVAKNTRERIHNIDLLYTIEQESASGATGPANLVPRLKERILLDLDSRSYRWSSAPTPSDHASGSGPEARESSYHNGTQMVLVPGRNSGEIAHLEKPVDNIFKRAVVLIAAMLLPEGTNGHGIDDGSLVSLLRFGTLRDKPEKIDGKPCWVVDAKAKGPGGDEVVFATAWIDLELCATLRKLMVFGAQHEAQCEYYLRGMSELEGDDGLALWLPTEIAMDTVVQSHKYKIKYHVDIEQCSLNRKLDDQSFVIAFPPGTRVVDGTSGRGFVVEGGPPSISTGPRWGGTFLVIINGLAAVALAGAWFAWRASRLRRTAAPLPGKDRCEISPTYQCCSIHVFENRAGGDASCSRAR